MKPLRTERMGEKAQGVRLYGRPEKQLEPDHFRVCLPGGDVDITRCDDGSYWVHVNAYRKSEANADGTCQHNGETRFGRFVDGRQDVHGQHASDCHAGELDNPRLYHLAVRIEAE